MKEIRGVISNVRYRVCVDAYDNGNFKGNIFNCYHNGPEVFKDSMELLNRLENTMDRLDYPQKTTKERSFLKTNKNDTKKRTERVQYMKDDFENKTGEKATFLIEIKHRENATWQGNIKWVEGKKEQNFRSVLELIKLMDEIVAEDND